MNNTKLRMIAQIATAVILFVCTALKLDVDKGNVESIVLIVLMIVFFAYSTWKNFPTTSAGTIADKIMHALKDGVIDTASVIALLEDETEGEDNIEDE